jgi:O-methyltransferase
MRESSSSENHVEPDDAQELYLDLLKKCLTRSAFPERYRRLPLRHNVLWHRVVAWTNRALSIGRLELVAEARFDPHARAFGIDHPPEAETMIGLARLDNLHECIRDVLRTNVPGDFIETGAWRGGATIFMRGALKAYGDSQRAVWVADSFQGLPKPAPEEYPDDAGDTMWAHSELAVSLEEVRANFSRYGLLDDRVHFLPGWFRDTLPTAGVTQLAILRLDGDMYESTSQALHWLYPKLSPGGFVIVDDYALPGCRAAVDAYRAAHGISEPIEPIDQDAVFWRCVTSSRQAHQAKVSHAPNVVAQPLAHPKTPAGANTDATLSQ